MSKTGRRENSAAGERKSQATRERRRRYGLGRASEWLAAGLLLAKGYRILGRNVRTPLGEIDLIAVRMSRLAFVEVKARDSIEEAEAAVSDRQSARIRRAADLWLGGNARYRNHAIAFDLVWVLPGRLPKHLEDAL